MSSLVDRKKVLIRSTPLRWQLKLANDLPLCKKPEDVERLLWRIRNQYSGVSHLEVLSFARGVIDAYQKAKAGNTGDTSATSDAVPPGEAAAV